MREMFIKCFAIASHNYQFCLNGRDDFLAPASKSDSRVMEYIHHHPPNPQQVLSLFLHPPSPEPDTW